MTYPTRITRRTPIVTVPARDLRAGATIVTNADNALELAAVGLTRDRDHVRVHVALTGAAVELPASAPVRVYANK